ncbi:MATE family efflux transporter [Candidatus Gracilibacteria bacterium]|nr:MAG: MATE family efflux transporter [Candidatus Gracilibacteria bacterium]
MRFIFSYLFFKKMGFRQNYRNETRAIVEDTHAKFITGSIFRHVVVMSLTASIGLIALFLVDLIDFYFISLLGQKELAAAIGYAGTILFFTSSVSIGFSITMGALVSKNLGAKKPEEAKNFAGVIAFLIFVVGSILTLGIYFSAPYLLSLLGAESQTLDFAVSYLRIIIVGMPFLALGMGLNGILRAKGEAKHSMFVLLIGSFVNGILDPICIFGLGLGLEGAAYATLVSRFALLLAAVFFVYKNQFFRGAVFSLSHSKQYLMPIFLIAIPAVLTNLATPIGNAYIVSKVGEFGDSAVAGLSMVMRISPVAFAVIFALSGAIGPIIGQNLGAKNIDRIQQTIWESIKFSAGYIFFISLVLFFLQDPIIHIFHLTGEARELSLIFFQFLSWLFIFQAFVFIANAVFNNIGHAKNSTIINFLKATVFTMPFAYFGGQYYGASGVLIGQSIGFSIIGILAIYWCFKTVKKLQM